MRVARELLELRPKSLPFRVVAKLPALEPVADQLAHLQQKPQIAALHVGHRTGALKHLDHAERFGLGTQRPEHQQQVGWVAPLFFVG
jgi:hypothetical protein